MISNFKLKPSKEIEGLRLFINKLFLGALVFLSLLVRDSFSAAKVPEDIDFSRLNVLSKFAKNDREIMEAAASLRYREKNLEQLGP